MEIKKAWRSVMSEFEINLSRVNYSTWIKPLLLEGLEDVGPNRAIVTISCPSGFHRQIIEQRYYGQIQKPLEEFVGKKIEIALKVRKELQNKQGFGDEPLFGNGGRAAVEEKKRMTSGNRRASGLNPRLSFETYVVGSSNNFAHAAAQGVIKNPGKKYNPLFIYGGVGLGKTHLMHAIGHELCKNNPDYKVLYISAETFANELISSLQSKSTASFKKKYRSCSVLLIDDIQFISGKEFTQEEFFHTFNELHMSERQIILTSDRPPQEIPKIEERLSSRFLGGLTVDIQPPDYEMRIAMLKQKMAVFGVVVPIEALDIIAERVESNVRELEGTFARIIALADSRSILVSTELVREYFGVEKARKSKRLRPASIISKTAKHYSYKSSELMGKSRKAPLVTARHVAMYIMKTELDVPYERIGELFGGRDHTTIMHGVEKIAAALKTDKDLQNQVFQIKQSLFP